MLSFAQAFRVVGSLDSHPQPTAASVPAHIGIESGIRIEPLAARKIGAARWDAFAALCDASYMSGYHHLRAQALKAIGRSRYRFFEIWLNASVGRRKIAQCVVVSSRHGFSIEDRLHLLPEHAGLWAPVMSALMKHLGPGKYHYGGAWSCERSREADLRAIAGVRVDGVHSFAVQGVAFASWPDWDRYWAKVSDSVRYEAKHAPERVPGLVLMRFRGLSMLRTVPWLVRLQAASVARKRLHFGQLKHLLRHAYYIVLCAPSLEIVLAKGNCGVLAAFYGTQMGGNMHYIYGGQRAGNSGANWYLLREMARAAYHRNPAGRFLMGRVDYAIHDERIGGGLLRARRALRVSDFETAIVSFSYNR